MFKRGMSTIIVTIIMITLVLAAVGVVWVIVQNILEEGADDISLGALKINLDIEKVKITDTGVEIQVKRNAGKADLIGINFIISDGVDTQVFEETTTMSELATKTFTLSYTGFVKSVEIAPVLRSESGKEKIVNVVDKQKVVYSNPIFKDDLSYGTNWDLYGGGTYTHIIDIGGDRENVIHLDSPGPSAYADASIRVGNKLELGKTYTLSFDTAGQSGKDLSISIEYSAGCGGCYSPNHQIGITYPSSDFSGLDEWVRKSFVFKVEHQEIIKDNYVLEFLNHYRPVNVYVDNIRIDEGDVRTIPFNT